LEAVWRAILWAIALNLPKPRPVLDLTPADWLTAGVEGFALGVRSLIPDRFEAFGRILHPVGRIIGQAELSAPDVHVPEGEPALRWADIAERTGRTIHPGVQFDSLIGAPREADRPYEAEVGTLDRDLYAALCDLLEAHTSTPQQCWFCLWDGYGQLQGGAAVAKLDVGGAAPVDEAPQPPAFEPAITHGPRVSIPGREYLLLEGHLRGWGHFFAEWWESPNIIWPEDRAWCVATEIDLDSTYLGGSAELIESLVADDRFEALEVRPDDPIDTTGDTINGPVVPPD